MNRATVVRVDGSVEFLDHRPTLEEAQKIVGDWVEFVEDTAYVSAKKVTLVCDEEGLLKNKPVNRGLQAMGLRPLVGDVIILEGWQTLGGP